MQLPFNVSILSPRIAHRTRGPRLAKEWVKEFQSSCITLQGGFPAMSKLLYNFIVSFRGSNILAALCVEDIRQSQDYGGRREKKLVKSTVDESVRARRGSRDPSGPGNREGDPPIQVNRFRPPNQRSSLQFKALLPPSNLRTRQKVARNGFSEAEKATHAFSV